MAETVAESLDRLRLAPERGAGLAAMEVEGSEGSSSAKDLRRKLQLAFG